MKKNKLLTSLFIIVAGVSLTFGSAFAEKSKSTKSAGQSGVKVEKKAEKPQVSDSKEKAIRDFLEITKADQMGKQIMDQMMAMFAMQAPGIPIEFWEAAMEEMATLEFVEMIVPLYGKYFTESEINDLIAFHKTPTGQKLLSVQPQLMQESMQVGQKWGMEMGQRIEKRATELMKAKEEKK